MIDYRKPTTTHYRNARNRASGSLQDRLNTTCALIGEAAPVIDRRAEIAAAGLALTDNYRPAVTAHRLARAALEPGADIDALVRQAIDDRARAAAWDDLALNLARAADAAASEAYAAAAADTRRKLAPVVTKTMTAIKRAAVKLAAVADPFDAAAVVAARADVNAVHTLADGLATLGTVSALSPSAPEDFTGLLRFVAVDAADDYADPAAASVRKLTRNGHLLDIDQAIVGIARGDYPGVTLSYTADDAEVAARAARVKEALDLPAPMKRQKFAPGMETREARRRLAVGPETR